MGLPSEGSPNFPMTTFTAIEASMYLAISFEEFYTYIIQDVPMRDGRFHIDDLRQVKPTVKTRIEGLKEIQSQKVEPLYLTRNHFCHVLVEAMYQVFDGKGRERHGGDDPLENQHWVELAEHHGLGFCTGQAEKKLREAMRMKEPDRFKRELLGAIVYTTFAIMKKESDCENGNHSPDPSSENPS